MNSLKPKFTHNCILPTYAFCCNIFFLQIVMSWGRQKKDQIFILFFLRYITVTLFRNRYLTDLFAIQNEGWIVVLGSAGIGLISQECGSYTAEWLTLTSQTNVIFYTMWYRAWYLSWGVGQRRVIAAWEQAGHRAVRQLHSVFFSVSFTVVTVLFLCYSVKLSLSQHTSFAFIFRFSSPYHQKRWRNEQAAKWFLAAGWD